MPGRTWPKDPMNEMIRKLFVALPAHAQESFREIVAAGGEAPIMRRSANVLLAEGLIANVRRQRVGTKWCDRVRLTAEGQRLMTILQGEQVKSIADGLPTALREEIGICYPRGIGLDNRHAMGLANLGLCTVLCSRGPFAVDVEWTPLGHATAAHLPPELFEKDDVPVGPTSEIDEVGR